MRSQLTGSTATGRGSGGQFTSRVNPARSTAARNTPASSAVSAARSTTRASLRARPASRLEKVSRLLTSVNSRVALRQPVSTRSRCTAGNGAVASVRASANGPRMRVNGVRNSWLTLAKKSVLTRSSSAIASTRRRSSSYSWALRNATEICWARSWWKERYASSSPRLGLTPASRTPSGWSSSPEGSGSASAVRTGSFHGPAGSGIRSATSVTWVARPSAASASPQAYADGPGSVSSTASGRARAMPLVAAGAGDPSQRRAVAQVDGGERHVQGVVVDHVDQSCAGGVHVDGAPVAEHGQVAQETESAFADHLLGDLAADGQHADGAAVVVAGRGVGDAEVRLLAVAGPLQQQLQRGDPAGHPGRHGLLDQRGEHVPALGQGHPHVVAERGRVLVADQRRVGVVVELGVALTPEQQHGVLGGEHHPDGGAQALRPSADRAERGACPVQLCHQPRGLTVAEEQVAAGSCHARSGPIASPRSGPDDPCRVTYPS